MLKKILKWTGALIFLIVLAGAGLFIKAQYQYNKAAELVLVDPRLTLEGIPQANWVSEGERIAKMKGCFDCHGTDMGGKVFIQDPAIGTYVGTNLTKGKNGIGSNYTDADWVRSIRYGIGPHKKYLRFMPSQEYSFLTDEDLGKLIAYLKTLPSVDRENSSIEVGPLAKFLYSSGKMPLLFSGQNIDSKQIGPATLQVNDSVDYGKYLSASCVGCHQPNFAGGAIPGVPPSWPHAANLTSKGNFAKWSFTEFKKVATEGVTPEGKTLNPQFMPWLAMTAMNEIELKALYNYLKSLPASETN